MLRLQLFLHLFDHRRVKFSVYVMFLTYAGLFHVKNKVRFIKVQHSFKILLKQGPGLRKNAESEITFRSIQDPSWAVFAVIHTRIVESIIIFHSARYVL